LSNSVVSIKNLSFSYDKDLVLDNINLEVKQKDFLAIIGPNGGGKSTLIKLILNLLKPFKNSIININGIVGYVPQNTNVNINFPIKVIEVVMMGKSNKNSKIFGYTADEKNLAIKLLKKVGMSSYENEKIGSLSGGQRQRVMIARALYSNPTILILDEPTSSIDIQGQKQIYELLKELNRQITIIVVSHDISVILKYATKVAHINKIISFHNMYSIKSEFKTDTDEHFCEVELLELLNQTKHKKSCKC
jgi:zinc transport system ATP-binding protein